MTDCNCLACDNGLGDALTRIVQSFGGRQAKNKIAASYGLELETDDIEQHCEAYGISDTASLVETEIGIAHSQIDLNEITPDTWGLSLDRDEEAVTFLQNQLFAMTLMQVEICKSQQQQYLKGETELPPSGGQFRVLDQLLRNLDRYTGISLNAYQQKALEVSARIQVEQEQSKTLPLELPEQ